MCTDIWIIEVESNSEHKDALYFVGILCTTDNKLIVLIIYTKIVGLNIRLKLQADNKKNLYAI